ncbi:MAG: phosphoribosyltransferase regulatory subunit [Clostridia bacterium]|nr:phosphoribosyltransferase regulatory subunit [Clostridia bacterium]
MPGVRRLQLPAGVQDLLPAEAAAKRRLEEMLLRLFSSWGYREVVTPTFEFIEALDVGPAASSEELLYKFIDREGHILALRPDLTTPIARLTATKLRHSSFPLRLCYAANVFRYEAPQAGRMREFHQAGVELIGADGSRADAEVIALAVEALQEAGLVDFRIGIGQVAITKAVLAELELQPEAEMAVKEALVGKDLVRLTGLLAQYSVPPAASRRVEGLFGLHGGEEVLERATGLLAGTPAARYLRELEEVFIALKALGLQRYLFIDLGILRAFDYYTGIVFEGYVPGLGFPVCGGGRYDELLEQFGFPCPATGFALGIERLLMARDKAGVAFPPSVPGYLVAGPSPASLLREARRLRQQGAVVELDAQGWSREEAEKQARERGLNLIWVDD